MITDYKITEIFCATSSQCVRHFVSNDYSVGYPFRELGWEINEEINPQVYSKKEWKDYEFSPFHKNVEHDKIVLL